MSETRSNRDFQMKPFEVPKPDFDALLQGLLKSAPIPKSDIEGKRTTKARPVAEPKPRKARPAK